MRVSSGLAAVLAWKAGVVAAVASYRGVVGQVVAAAISIALA